MQCQRCHSELSDDSLYCHQCGAPATSPSGPAPATFAGQAPGSAAKLPISDSTSAADEETLWRAAVQKRVEYYLPKFRRYAAGARTFPSWHWPAFFASFWWSLYRKSWAGALFYFFLPIVCGVLGLSIDAVTSEGGSSSGVGYAGASLLAFVLAPLFANGFYYRKVRSLVAQARATSSEPSAQVAYLAGAGGTSNVAVVIIAVLGLVSGIGILAAIAIPQYQSYTIRAKVAQALAAVDPIQREIADTWTRTGRVPEDLDLRALQGTPGGELLGNVELDSDNGTLTLTFSGAAGTQLSGKSIVLAPRVSKQGQVTWQCLSRNVPPLLLPANCRGS